MVSSYATVVARNSRNKGERMSNIKEFDRERFNRFIANIDQEILNMRSGEGRFRPGALHFEKDKASPVLNRLELLKANPTKDNLTQFLDIAKQDFGAATAKAFTDWSASIFPVDPMVRKTRVVKPFDVAIKDGFYNLFKVVQIPMSPKQLELMEATSLRLAHVFEEKIAAEVKAQLTTLVSKAKADNV
jgi:hypothetical protein